MQSNSDASHAACYREAWLPWPVVLIVALSAVAMISMFAMMVLGSLMDGANGGVILIALLIGCPVGGCVFWGMR